MSPSTTLGQRHVLAGVAPWQFVAVLWMRVDVNTQEIQAHCWFNVGPPSQTVAQHWTDNGSMYFSWWTTAVTHEALHHPLNNWAFCVGTLRKLLYLFTSYHRYYQNNHPSAEGEGHCSRLLFLHQNRTLTQPDVDSTLCRYLKRRPGVDP